MKTKKHLLIRPALLAAATGALVLANSARAADYTWGGGNLNWSDTSASGWNGGPPAGGDNATINSGIVTLTTNNLTNGLASVTIGGTGKLAQTTGNTWSAFNNLTLSGGTLESVRTTTNAFGAYQISNIVTVSGSSASTISTNGSGNIFINLGLAVNDTPTFTTFSVADVTSSTAADLNVSTVLADNVATNFVSFSAAGLIKTGAGTMTLSANNIYTGGTTVNNGVLEVAGSSGGNSYIRGTVTVNSGAELRYTGGDGTGFGFNGGNKLDTINIDGGLVNSQGTMTHIWTATVNMTGGELRVNGGTSNPTGDRIEWNNTTVNTAASSNTASITGRINFRADNSSVAVFNVADGAAATDLLVSAAITQSATVGITKDLAGTMELTGTNSYLGATQLSAGKLLVNGNNSAATGEVTVASGATLGGSGTIGGSVSVTGSIAPGSSGIGTLTTGMTTWNSGDAWKFELGTPASSDKLLVNGDFLKGTGSTFQFDFMGSNPSLGTYTLIDWSNLGSTTFSSSDFSFTGLTGYTGSAFTINGSQLDFTVIPELSNILIGGLLGAGLLRRRRA